MKNKEKFAKEIIDIVCKGGKFAATKNNKIVNCDYIDCKQCLFNFDDDYDCYCNDNYIEQWAESEYVEEPTITSREQLKVILVEQEGWI